MIQTIKDNIVSIGAIVSTVGVIAGSVVLMDTRYAHAQDIQQKFQHQNSQIILLRIDNTRRHYDTKIDTIKEKQLQLMVKPIKTEQDRAIINHYTDEIVVLNKKSDTEVEEIKKGLR